MKVDGTNTKTMLLLLLANDALPVNNITIVIQLARLVKVANIKLPIPKMDLTVNSVSQEHNLKQIQQNVQIALTESTNHLTLYLLSNVKHVQKKVLQLLVLLQPTVNNVFLDVIKI